MALPDFALVVGIDSYPGLGALKGAEADASDFWTWVTDPAGGNVKPEFARRIVSSQFTPPPASADLAKPVKAQIEEFFTMVSNEASKNNQAGLGIAAGRRLYLFFSGHGFAPALDRSGVLMANATDDMPHNIGAQMWADRLYDGAWFEEVLLFQDACRERMGYADITPPFFRIRSVAVDVPRKRFYAFSAKNGQLAVERPLANGTMRGVFTSTLLEGLRGHAADPASGAVTTNQLKVYLQSNMQTKLSAADLENGDIAKVPEVFDPDPFVIIEKQPPTFPVELQSAAPGKVLDANAQVVASDFSGAPPWSARLKRGLYKYVVPGASSALFEVTGAVDANDQPIVTRVNA